MKPGEQLHLTDGKGTLHTTEIINDHKKLTQVQVLSTVNFQPPTRKITLAVSLVKNSNRFEWFLEKATEIGVNEFIPMICERTEKQHFRLTRMKGIIISAMLQSRQVWLPNLKEPLLFTECINNFNQPQKFIAHCLENEKQSLIDVAHKESGAIILIGPEGDFTPKEIELAIQNNYMAVSLGKTRLRTETAGLVAASLLVL
jgi:16S rRNA (uracil1498-N3)-methyltransferase